MGKVTRAAADAADAADASDADGTRKGVGERQERTRKQRRRAASYHTTGAFLQWYDPAN